MSGGLLLAGSNRRRTCHWASAGSSFGASQVAVLPRSIGRAVTVVRVLPICRTPARRRATNPVSGIWHDRRAIHLSLLVHEPASFAGHLPIAGLPFDRTGRGPGHCGRQRPICTTGSNVKKIGEFWIPDVDALPGRNLECSIAGFGEGQGIQIDHLRRALELVPGRKLAVDGGANVGAWARLMARHFEAVVSFEPNPAVYPCLARNVDEWGISDRVTTYPNGISDRPERVGIVTKGTGRTVTGRLSGEGDIECVTIDSLELSDCSFLKLDVEGHEQQALNGARETIRSHRPWIMIENEPKRVAFWRIPTEAEKILAAMGYKLVERIGERQLDWLYRPKE